MNVASLAPKQRCSGRRAARNFPKAADTAASTVIQSTPLLSAAEGEACRKTILVTEGNSEGFREQAKKQRLSFPRREPNRVFPAFRFLWFEKIPTLRRNLAVVSVLYFSERPEIAPHDEESKKGQKQQRKSNNE